MSWLLIGGGLGGGLALVVICLWWLQVFDGASFWAGTGGDAGGYGNVEAPETPSALVASPNLDGPAAGQDDAEGADPTLTEPLPAGQRQSVDVAPAAAASDSAGEVPAVPSVAQKESPNAVPASGHEASQEDALAAPLAQERPHNPAPPASRRQTPRQGDGCRRILDLYRAVPAALTLTSLSGHASGEFRLEGYVAAGDEAVLEQWQKDIQGRSSRVGLESWREGGRVRFVLDGTVSGATGAPLVPQDAAAAAQTREQWRQQARRAGLDGIELTDPNRVALDAGKARWRHKLWAIAPIDALRDFVSLQAAAPHVALDEFVVLGRPGSAAKFYAVLDLVVENRSP